MKTYKTERLKALLYILGMSTVIMLLAVAYMDKQNVNFVLNFNQVNQKTLSQNGSQGKEQLFNITSESYKKNCNIVITDEMDLMKMENLPFVKRFKNPCWYNGRLLRCLPYMYLVGVAKCGTTDLFQRITLHPDFVSPTIKEPAWLSQGRFWRHESFSQYTSKFFSPLSEKLLQSKSTHLITGDASINTLEGSHFWPYIGTNIGHGEPVENNPEYIYHLNNDTRILINVRNPVDRLWSEYLAFSKSVRKSPKIFHRIVQRELEFYTDCLQTRTLRSCMYDRPLAVFSSLSVEERPIFHQCCSIIPRDFVILRRGVYHVFIKDYLKVFPREHVLIQRLEDISEDPETALIKTYTFLGLKIPSKARMQKILGLDVRNSRKPSNVKKGDMLPSTRRLLFEFYKPYNKQLSLLLNDTKYNYGPRE